MRKGFAKIPDDFYENPTIRSLSNASIGLWVKALAYCSRNGTNGLLDKRLISSLSPLDKNLKRSISPLVNSGLWIETEGYYQFKNWTKYQNRYGQTEKKREYDREYQAKKRAEEKEGIVYESCTKTKDYRLKTKDNIKEEIDKEEKVASSTDSPNVNPPSPSKAKKATKSNSSKGERIKESWTPSEEMLTKLSDRYPDVDLLWEKEKFLAYWLNENSVKALKRDWNRAFLNWVSRSAENSSTTKIGGNKPYSNFNTPPSKREYKGAQGFIELGKQMMKEQNMQADNLIELKALHGN